ncbi:MAG: response regulator transcription factor [Clostridiales bacterium]|nr:response regulator transcription factor [Clostridiales bacterium]
MVKILFLEDEPTILDVTTEYMKMNKYEVITAVDAKEAINMVKKNDFDLAILDIMVPRGSGLDVLDYIKKNKSNMGTIMLTALGDEKTQLAAFNLYADDYVIKPFSPLLLLKRIEAVLRRTKALKNNLIETNGLCIKKESYEAFYNNKSLNLTLSEFLLLQTLMDEPNRAFTREQLIYRIFDESYSGNNRIIDAHVKNLRKKLPYNFIKTIAGVGYQFNKEVE